MPIKNPFIAFSRELKKLFSHVCTHSSANWKERFMNLTMLWGLIQLPSADEEAMKPQGEGTSVLLL